VVSFPDAIKNGFSGYATWSGRSTRAEYWWWALFVWILSLIPYIIWIPSMSSTNADGTTSLSLGLGFWLLIVIDLVLLLPTLSVLVRRLHDTNRSGWWFWIYFVPCIGGIWLLVLTVLPSDPAANNYG
jgi:uncharacterized membrane protein YhaH (DUF805 family)